MARRGMADGNEPTGEILFEFTRVGTQMRVAAIDAATGIEVITVAPVSASRRHMQQVATAKLRRRMQQRETRS